MAEQAGHGDGQGATPGRDPGLPDGGIPGSGRGSYLPGFARGGEWDGCAPSASLALALESASGPEWRCPGASRDEMFGLLRQWQALESRAAAGKLGILRALIREDDQPLPGGGYHGDLPAGWTKSLTHEVAAALSMPAISAERLMWLAWDLAGRLPGVGGLLAAGTLTVSKAKAVNEALQQLSSEDAAAAEAMILPDLPGKTYGQTVKLAVQAAITVDPQSATRRREDAERNLSRVTMFREESGAAALSGRDMPTDETLAAHASVCARAQEYQDSGAFPDDTRMDQYRVAAYLDLLNGTTLDARIASGTLPGTCTGNSRSGDREPPADGQDTPDTDDKPAAEEPASNGRDCSCHECDGGCVPPDDDEHGDDPDGGAPTDEGPRGGPGSGGGHPDDGASPGVDHGSDKNGGSPADDQSDGRPGTKPTPAPPARLADLVLPLATLLGLAERPGEGFGLGPLDPDLCRDLATAAAGSPYSLLCVTVTDSAGIAIGHGCARAALRGKYRAGADHARPTEPVRPGRAQSAAALPARVNLTITADRLTEQARTAGPPGRASWAFTRDTDPGPPDGYGRWTLTLPDGRNLVIELQPVPTFECDHRFESHAYQPNGTLRHLVQIRDGDCTFPPCSRHARESDFEHAIPFDKGGRTCTCNAGARSRSCHQIKQSPGWNVTQPRPGWHQWTTPTGRTYIQGPKQYPV